MEESETRLKDIYGSLEDYLKRFYYGWEGSSQFNGTSDRLMRAFGEFCWAPDRVEHELGAVLSAEFDYSIDEMLVEGPISIWTLCPHHLLPCHFTVYVGYVPNGRVLGLSKFARAAVIFGKRPVIQEMYTKGLADVIEDRLHPKGTGVLVLGRHNCMQSRGVTQNASVTTSVLYGVIRDKPEVRSEFYSLVRERRN
jgi:GTP cyclohydrolase I